ncbi:MAG: fumarate reductase (quinol) flavoprotein subunit [Rhodospirillaceae bacterium]|jgi:fumarate reductase flavoprotein subunit|nr:fumarate reductase (quinol) flavoprotein subunit [Rhodospirillaceae bacterium]MBT5243621.1 fumarate reductase (quinol) flavoprotein subunit [Rhodospirillaceae bacterium]MBT5562209.1 fumarate reductase (quinol) flavoprotein subunit [Rhodospirillaceae bacterium]MBT6242382.1 fumarate reductase (quinol) flavoprotein subunit [Rhodospirillaceae bacterium]MBT7138912.1 fumarate reductase (quinol) flavoprotein subunit [Rhodospirillaceae bacterium]
MEMITTDVVIIGAGGAGLRAAIAIAETSPDVKIALLSKVYPMRSHTVAAEGGAAGVAKDEDSFENHFNDTVAGGDWLCDQDAVDLFVKEAPRELTQLEHWGCPWSREADGSVSVRPFGGMKVERTWYAADKTGFHMLHTLFQTSLKYPSIERYDEFYSTDLLVVDGHARGVAAIEMRSGQLRLFRAKAVIIATGGAGRIFPFTTNGAIKTGDGMAMAYRAGVALKDMEFVQYHPTGLPGTGILITEGSRGEGGILVNKDGYRYLQDYNLGPPDPWPRKKAMELGPRDRLSQAFWHEQQKGRTISGPHGDVVHLDIRHLGEKKIDERLPLVRDLAISYVGVDPVHEPIPVRPVVHYTMGGIDSDIDAKTSLTGLFVAGECACVSINGANRLGSNSLTELLVFGKRAGLAAAKLAAAETSHVDEADIRQQAQSAQDRVTRLYQSAGGGESVSGLRREMNTTMEAGAGIYRTEESLSQTCSTLVGIRHRFANIELEDKSNVYNTDLIQALELGAMIDVAGAIAVSALERKESRGSHQRLDFEQRDDDNFLKHSLAYYDVSADPRIDYRDVIITRSQPGERVYGGKQK